MLAGQENKLLLGCMVLFGAFFLLLASTVVPNANMFLKKHARMHRVMGLVHLSCLLCGFFVFRFGSHGLLYHLLLGACGTATTLTAAYDFRFHDKVKNKASGTLQKETLVTFGEMIEHSFYQGLNVLQILTLHMHAWLDKREQSAGIFGDKLVNHAALVLVATAPWLVRRRFPVNSFMANYKDVPLKDYSIEQLLYRIKKWQYVLYKHALLHGLNISVATQINTEHALVHAPLFQIYWLALNTSYVMEFFTQTLVKKRYLSQANHLILQRLLMGVSTVSALFVLSYVRVGVAIVSHFLNVYNRGNDFFNVCLLLGATMAYDHVFDQPVSFF